jgi:hypothetical protein
VSAVRAFPGRGGAPGSGPRGIALLVEMPRLLSALGFTVNERSRRCACLLHAGSNPTAFSWREDGLWHCFSCGAGGDRVALVRAVRRCGFREAMDFLAALAGVEYPGRRVSAGQVARMRARRERAEAAGWAIRDALVRFESKCARALILVERLQRAIGQRLAGVAEGEASTALWGMLGELAPVATYFLAVWDFLGRANPEARVRFALASSGERGALIAGDCHAG